MLISNDRILALQKRVNALHAQKLLSHDELCVFQDIVGDYLEIKSSVGVLVTLNAISADKNSCKLLKIVGASEGLLADEALSRQLRRKYLDSASASARDEL